MSRFTLSPRAALLLVGVVGVLALGVIVSGWWGGGRGGGTDEPGVSIVTGAPTAGTPGPPGTASAPSSAPASAPPAASGSASAAPDVAVLYVVGAVEHAGVVRVAADARVTDALTAAGGAAADADLSRLNLARPVVDGERLYVPRIGEAEVPAELPPGGGAGAGAGAGGSGSGADGAGGGAGAAAQVVDLNTADATALETLPGIGPALAERILAWRDEHGGFRSVEDLLEVSGIGEGRFAELQDRVTV
ncbi:helix-hairpin-helix domain-containing protein [Curtobacterium sp. MCLR17_032]|uniref:ComEA family DNA-binding protein n=1 Tax=Curtobacterium sp. MCLR17_032 TaxID=2175650 RepID=UPI000DA78F10|nr:helix-hairpin-helix domain-containing protein [Curtobacterium sp. MCLR17_032]WIE62914.1 helix-hairpin-helix domain-containing protein [Curtobacterium sp. MCLR17_032]